MSMSLRVSTVALIVTSLTLIFYFAPANATIRSVSVSNNQFSPSTISINHGDTVRWIRQPGSTSHTSTSDPLSPKEWDSGTLQISVPFDVQFTASDGNGPFTYHCGFHATMKGTITVQTMSVELEQSGSLPSTFALDQNYPNPFNPATAIRFTIDRTAEVNFSVYNILGEQVESNDFGLLSPGTYTISWDSNSARRGPLPSGVYFYRLRSGEQLQTRKMVLLK